MKCEFIEKLWEAKQMEMAAFKSLIPEDLRPHVDTIEGEVQAIGRNLLNRLLELEGTGEKTATSVHKIKISEE